MNLSNFIKNILKLFEEPEEPKKMWVPWLDDELDLRNDDYHVRAYIKIWELGKWNGPYKVILASCNRSPSKDYIELGGYLLDQVPDMVVPWSRLKVIEITENLIQS